MKIFSVHGELGATVIETIARASVTSQGITGRVLCLDSPSTQNEPGSYQKKEEMKALVDEA